jgi:hypothetical protein
VRFLEGGAARPAIRLDLIRATQPMSFVAG